MDKEKELRIKNVIQDIQQLPTLPTIYNKLSNSIGDPKTSARKVSGIIEDDQALTIKIFKIINSAFYSFPQKITTISHAVVLLGFNEIKHIALAASIIDLFGETGEEQRFNHDEFWKHSLAVGVCSRIIAKKVGAMKIKDAEEAFTAGLVHDIGKIVEDQFMHDEFAKMLLIRDKLQTSMRDAEMKTFGFTHQEVGQFLSERWQLPDSFAGVIGYHNSPANSKVDTRLQILIAVVHIADILVHALELGNGGDSFIPQIDDASWELLGFSKSYIEIIMSETKKGFEDVADILSKDKEKV